jgi:hypothetical protein
MTREEDVKDARLFDLRTVERNIKRGLITRKDYEKFLKSLADVAPKVASDGDTAAAAASPSPSPEPVKTGPVVPQG